MQLMIIKGYKICVVCVGNFEPLMLINWICQTKSEMDLFLYIRKNTLEHKFKQWFWTPKPVLNVHLKDFWYTKINPTQICYDKFN